MRIVSYDGDKFRELLLYIAEKTADHPGFGDTHLNKVLYWSDFFGYSHLGRPITGAKYRKSQYGPTARALKPAREQLEAEGALRVEMRPIGGVSRRVTVSQREAETALFTSEELALVDDVIRQVKGHTAVSISALSHRQSAGWNLIEEGDDIPYSTALVSQEPPSEATLARGRELAQRFGW